MSHDQTLSLFGSHVRVICRRGQFYISEFGRTFPATAGEVENQFGWPFAEAVVNCPEVWIEFDASEQARIECNRSRFVVIGYVRRRDFDGARLFGVWDLQEDRLFRGGVARSAECSSHYIDELTPEILEIHARGLSVIFPPPYEYKPVAVRNAGNVAAVDAVSALFNPPPKPAA